LLIPSSFAYSSFAYPGKIKASAPVDPFSSLISILVYVLVLPAAGIARFNGIGINSRQRPCQGNHFPGR
ncbi:MAG TPA: hypothetical protein PLQ38_08290, partial [Methanothrix sp.]|nr:hypothetical protein [Methanothrix sp.]